AWLNDLSSKPPASETMHALKSIVSTGAGLSPVAVAVGVSAGGAEHAAKAKAVTAASAPIRIVFFMSVLLTYFLSLQSARPLRSFHCTRETFRLLCGRLRNCYDLV